MKTAKNKLTVEYQLRFANTKKYRNSVWQILCSRFFQKLIPKQAGILDLGAGWGEFINNIDAGTKYAMDLNPETLIHLQEDIVFMNQDCSKQWPLDKKSLDVVFTSNFLEHLPSKKSIELTIDEANRCLKDDGTIICLGPNIWYLAGTYWDFWDHFIPISHLSLCELLKLKGFEIDRCVPRFLPYSMSNGKTPPLTLLKIFLNFPILWPIVGRQFLIIGKKKTELQS